MTKLRQENNHYKQKIASLNRDYLRALQTNIANSERMERLDNELGKLRREIGIFLPLIRLTNRIFRRK